MKIFATSALFCALLLFAACGGESATDQGTNSNTPEPNTIPAPPATETVLLDVSGMTWGGGCPPQVRNQLEEVEGVISADVSFGDKTATVVVKKGTDPEKVAGGLSGQFSGTVKR